MERVFQVRQNFIRLSGRQTLKFGFDFNPMRDAAEVGTFLGGRIIFGEAIPLSSIIDQAAGAPLSSLLKASLTAAGLTDLAGYVDRRYRPSNPSRFGLPLVYQQGFGPPTGPDGRTARTSSWRMRSA